MSNIQETLKELLAADDGSVVVAIVDSESGMTLGSAGAGVDVELAAAGNTEVVRAKLKIMKTMKLDDVIEDMLITLGKQYHIICLLPKAHNIFLYYVLDKSKANLALARLHLHKAAENLIL